jgi:hypothetical protein
MTRGYPTAKKGLFPAVARIIQLDALSIWKENFFD